MNSCFFHNSLIISLMIASFRVTLLLRSKVWFPSKLIRKGIRDSLSPSCLGHHRSTRKMERCIRPITRYLVEMVGRAKLWRKDNIADILLCVDHMKFFSQLIFSTIILIYQLLSCDIQIIFLSRLLISYTHMAKLFFLTSFIIGI